MYLAFILVPGNRRFRLKSINIFSTFSTVVKKLSLFKWCLKYRLSNNQNEFLQKDAPSLFGFLPSSLMLNICHFETICIYVQGTVIDLQVSIQIKHVNKYFFLLNNRLRLTLNFKPLFILVFCTSRLSLPPPLQFASKLPGVETIIVIQKSESNYLALNIGISECTQPSTNMYE